MKKVTLIAVVNFCLFSSIGYTYTGMCPFSATDSNILSLAEKTSSSLQALLDKKNECNEAVQAAVTAAKGLPDLIKQTQDPASTLLAEEEWVNEEISKAITDSTYGAKIDNLSGMTYLDSLLHRKNQIPGEIKKIRIAKEYNNKENAKAQTLYTTQNLISNLSSTMSNRDSKCAQAISGGLGARVLTMGLGLVSSTAPIFMAGKATSAALSANLLSDFVNMFSKMPPKSLQKFDEANQTVDLACLYYQVTMSHCSMVEQSDSTPLKINTKKSLIKSAQCLPQNNLYGQILNLKELATELQNIASSIARNSPLNSEDSNSSAFNRDLTELFFGNKQNNPTSPGDLAKEQLNQFNFLSKYFGPSASLSSNNLSLSESSSLNYGLSNFISNMSMSLRNAGFNFKDFGNAQENFKQNFSEIQKYLQKKANELNLENDSSVLSIADAKRLHEMVNKADFKRKIQYARDTYNSLKKYVDENKDSNPEQASDLFQLSIQSDRSIDLLDSLEKWAKLTPKSTSKEDQDFYQIELSKLSREIKLKLNLKNGSTSEINENLNYLIGDPLRKAETIFLKRESKTDNSPFAKPFDSSQSKLTDYEKFNALMRTYKSIADSTIQPGDQSLMAETRRLFESTDSNLRDVFSTGLENMIDGINSSPDPKASKYLVSQMCALAYSLPNGDKNHSIKRCKDVLPQNMTPYLYTDKRTYPDCSAYNYFKETLRNEYFSTGKSSQLPSAAGVDK